MSAAGLEPALTILGGSYSSILSYAPVLNNFSAIRSVVVSLLWADMTVAIKTCQGFSQPSAASLTLLLRYLALALLKILRKYFVLFDAMFIDD